MGYKENDFIKTVPYMGQISTEEVAEIGRMNLTNGNELLYHYVVDNIITKESNNDIFAVVLSLQSRTNREPVWKYHILNFYIKNKNKVFIKEYLNS